ncbi:hypothetical protein L4X63_18500 [Geomonas sp. Red32]|uniref:hypothetical protein n=1 Tax=Geomonas sp. Red32 TaxID=2912856 RepID=UPI00202D060A|nr:hypothetical protein [Geomonas sp. Red32]MCM0083580.1 hypothetical protein [Geomonas sp. Red32]
MKRIAIAVMVLGLFGAMPVLAADHEHMNMDTKEGVRQCAMQAETIQQKIKRLKTEVKKGNKEYSAEELKKLQDKLKEANDMLDSLTTKP